MASTSIFCTVEVEFETLKEVPDDLRKAVMKARAIMVDRMNAKGIERFNDLTDYLGISQIDYEDDGFDAYEKLSNACWSSELSKIGYPNIKIIKEVLYPMLIGDGYHVIITIAER